MSARPRGFTLVEVLTTCALVGIVTTLAVPGYQAQLLKSRRSDAVAALTRVQAAQERLRAEAGVYSNDFRALQVAASSSEGLYTLAIDLRGAETYRATATAVVGSAQTRDQGCAQLELVVNSGFATFGPDQRCWNR
jgi:type IV pilus assembly protein PilE